MDFTKTKLRLRELGIQLGAVSARGSAHNANEDFFDYMPCGNGLRLVVADEISQKVGVAPTEPGRVVRDALRAAVGRLADDALDMAHTALSRWLTDQGTGAAAGVCVAIADIQRDKRGRRTLEVASLGDISVFIHHARPWPFRPAFRRVVAPHVTTAGGPAAYLGRCSNPAIRSARIRLHQGDIVMLASDGGLGGVSEATIADLLAACARNPLARLAHVLSFLEAEASLNNITDDRTVALIAVE